VEKLGLDQDSGGAGKRRGGLGYDKRIRALKDCKLLSNADRTDLNPYGVNGGRAGGNYSVEVHRADGRCESLPGMVYGVEMRSGDLVQLTTTGGGGWGDPLRREPELVRYDVVCGNISYESALDDYGVVLTSSGDELL